MTSTISGTISGYEPELACGNRKPEDTTQALLVVIKLVIVSLEFYYPDPLSTKCSRVRLRHIP